MNRSESKYFNTAVRMDEAFLGLLEKKDFEFITVKEICEKANVNRSTFYLHYETIDDILTESVKYMNQQFLDYMSRDSAGIVSEINSCDKDELFLVTPEYLVPYLNYISDHKRLFETAMNNAGALRLDKTYAQMFRHVFAPILDRFDVPEKERGYLMAFYMSGMMALVSEWLKDDCSDSVEVVISIMQKCVMTGISIECEKK